jgi:ATP-dependent Clp endopeptidase proteolytic subunit ClpP
MSVYVDGELVLYGFVGDNYWDEGFTAREVLDGLSEHGFDNDITVRINSGGGYVSDGFAIYNALKAHKGAVKIVVDAVAASSASLIAMAGDEIVMRSGSLMMIHDPSGGAWGTAEELESVVASLEKMATNFAKIYADRSGRNLEEIRSSMKATTWMNAEETVANGFADTSDEHEALMASAFDYRMYAKTPDALKSLSEKNNWAFERAKPEPPHSAKSLDNEPKEKIMSGNNMAAEQTEAARAEGAEEATARIEEIMNSDAAKKNFAQASRLAFSTKISAQEAIAVLELGGAQPATETGGQQNMQAYEEGRMPSAGLSVPVGDSQRGKAEVGWGSIVASVNNSRKKR